MTAFPTAVKIRSLCPGITGHFQSESAVTSLRNHRSLWSGICNLWRVEPEHVSAYAEVWKTTHALPTIKLHLAALRRLFDWLVLQRVVDSNPAQVVRGPSYSARRGKAPVLDAEEVRALFDSIETNTLIGLRDRALMAVMVYSFSRIGAATKMKLKDVFVEGKHAFIRLHEKRGKRRELPTHQALHGHLSAYIKAAGLDDEEAPLFRSFKRATLTKRQLQTSQANGLGQAGIYELLREHMTPRPMSQADAYRMIRRRAAAAGLKTKLGNHSWRATGITTYLNNGGTLEKAQGIAGHASMDTTRLYDRREEADTRKEIARIRF